MSQFGISGIISGIDTDQWIASVMQIARLPITNLENKKEDLQTEKDVWRDINTRMSNLEAKVAALNLSTTFSSKSATSSDSDIVTVTAGSAAANGKYTIENIVTALAHRAGSEKVSTILSDSAADKDTDLNLSGSFELNGKTINVAATDSLAEIRDMINSTEDIGVVATIVDDRLTLSAEKTGVGNEVTAQYVSGDDILNTLGFTIGAGNVISGVTGNQTARNASFKLNGIDIVSTSNDVTGVVDGLTINLKDDYTGVIDVTVSQDVQSIVDAVNDFVEQYNSTFSFIHTEANVEMDGSEIESQGKIAGDSSARNMLLTLRNKVTDSTGSGTDLDQLYFIGIEIDEYGEMTFDESKLRAELDKDPDAVEKLFTAKKDIDGYDGVATRLDAWLDDNLKSGGFFNNREQYYDDAIDDIDDQIANLEIRMEKKEETLIKQFTRLETVLGELQAQSSWLTSQLASLSGANQQ